MIPNKHIYVCGIAMGLAIGCRSSPHSEEASNKIVPAMSSAAGSALPVDHLEPGELAEGVEHAFGFPLPRSFRITKRFADSLFASGEASPDDVVQYVRRRIDATTAEVGAARTIFPRVPGKNEAAGKLLRIEIVQGPQETEIVISNITPPSVDPGLSEAERWRRAGLNPNGQLADPTHVY